MKIPLPEVRIEDRRLGRHINHDPRSLTYRTAPAVVDISVQWKRHVDIFDQGNLGSCTGNAEAGLLASDPFFSTMPNILVINEAFAVKLYSLATKLDPYGGSWEPDDTGSDGMSVNKAAQQLGYINGYVWGTTLDEAKGLIQNGPFIVGTNWTTYMDDPGSDGIIRNPAGGSVRGGHEYVCRERDASRGLWWFDNSWGLGFGVAGRFAYDDAGLMALMAQGGDMTQSTPNTLPPPIPEPTTDQDIVEWWTATKPWATGHFFSRIGKAGKAASASVTLAQRKGLA